MSSASETDVIVDAPEFTFGQWRIHPGQHKEEDNDEERQELCYFVQDRTQPESCEPHPVVEQLRQMLLKYRVVEDSTDTFSCYHLLLSAISLRLRALNTDPHLIMGLLSGPRISDLNIDGSSSLLLEDLFELLGWEFTGKTVGELKPFIRQAGKQRRAGHGIQKRLDFSRGYAVRVPSPTDVAESQPDEDVKLHWGIGAALWRERDRRQRKDTSSRAKLGALAAAHFVAAVGTSPPTQPAELVANILLTALTLVEEGLGKEAAQNFSFHSFCQLPGVCLLPLAPLLADCNCTPLRGGLTTTSDHRCVLEALVVTLLRFKLLAQARKALDVLARIIQQPGSSELSLLVEAEVTGPAESQWLRLAKRLRDVGTSSEFPVSDPLSGIRDELGVAYFQNGASYCGEFREGCPKVHIDKTDVDGRGVFKYVDAVYDGELQSGKSHGKGSYTYPDGDTYDGQWKNALQDGKGVIVYADGQRYEGEWRAGQRTSGLQTYPDGNSYRGEFKDNGDPHGAGIYHYTNGDTYDGQLQDGQPDGKGVLVKVNGSRYDGEWVAGRRHGRGEEIFADGRSYTGQWKSDAMHGQGVWLFPNEDRYEGESQNGARHGTGIYYYANGDTYDGQWKDGKTDGKGVLVKADGSRHDGEWVAGARTSGLQTYPDGGSYRGEFKDGTPEGRGVWLYASKDRYEGEFKNGGRHGAGIYYYANGDTYDGQWKDHRKDGKGVQVLVNGSRYDGEWVAGTRHGRGEEIFTDGRSYTGQWKANTAHGQGVLLLPNGDRFEGESQNGVFHGAAICYYANGDTYDGQWKDGRQDGKGVQVLVNGSRYDGEWAAGTWHGSGLHTLPDGTTYNGQWKSNTMHGQGVFTEKDGTTSEGTFVENKKHGNFIRKPKSGAAIAEVWKDGAIVSSRELPKVGRK